jgi:hypothetical protein
MISGEGRFGPYALVVGAQASGVKVWSRPYAGPVTHWVPFGPSPSTGSGPAE